MRASPRFTLMALLALSITVAAALIFNGRQPVNEIPPPSSPLPESGKIPQVDQETLQNARQLSSLATGPEELDLAQEAERVADHEVDVAFGSVLRTAKDQPALETPETRAIERRLHEAAAAVEAGEARVQALTAAAKTAKYDRQRAIEQEIDLAQAEVQLERDEADDAQQDLVRAGGDVRGTLQRLLQSHEAGEHQDGAVRVDSASALRTQPPASNLTAQWSAWRASRDKLELLLNSQRDALARAGALSNTHDAVEGHVQHEKSLPRPTNTPAGSVPAATEDGAASAATLAGLHHLSDDKKNLSDLDKRIEDLKQLGAIYGQWGLLVKAQSRVIERGLLNSVLWILLAILLAFMLRALMDRFLDRLTLERKQQLTLQALLRFGVEALAVLAILLIVFGTPSQLSTILGLAGAGLTVVLKDFIVSFLGWFVLMGRNGIRVGDWVEINGVRGEVVEIGLLRTVLLETGNWTDAGQPTGRQVAFLNSYAVEGYYFNFTTSGQWLWDEIQVLIPPGENPYPLIEKVHGIVTKETEGSAQVAEQEWQRVTRRYGVRAPSPLAAVDVKPTPSGVQVTVRYMVRAMERSDLRSRLNHAVVGLLHGERTSAPLGEPVATSSASS